MGWQRAVAISAVVTAREVSTVQEAIVFVLVSLVGVLRGRELLAVICGCSEILALSSRLLLLVATASTLSTTSTTSSALSVAASASFSALIIWWLILLLLLDLRGGSIVVGVLGFGEVVGIYSGEVAGTPVEVQQVELMVPDLLPPSRGFGDLTELHSSAAEEQRRKQQRCL